MVRTVIFDLDGTILDSIDTLWLAFNAGVTAFKLELVVKERLLALMNRGDGLAEILVEVYPELKAASASDTVRSIMDEILREYLTRCAEETKLSRGVPELLAALRARGFRMGVVTNRTYTPQRLWQDLAKLQVAHFIDTVTTAAQSRRKPAPDALIECLKKMELLPEECIFVGDSQADMRAGKGAGVRTVAVATGVSVKGDLETESPDFIFDDLPSFTEELDFVLSQG